MKSPTALLQAVPLQTVHTTITWISLILMKMSESDNDETRSDCLVQNLWPSILEGH